MSSLPIIPGQDSPDGQILIKLGPMQAEGRHLDLREQVPGLAFQPGIAVDREAEVQTAGHGYINPTIAVERPLRDINQCAHATYL